MFLSQLSTAIFGDSIQANGNRNTEPVTTKETARGSINAGGMNSFAFSGMQGWRVSMEDAHMVCASIPVHGGPPLSEGHALFGVMDGHGGDFTSGFGADNFVKFFSETLNLHKYSTLKPSEQADVPGIGLLRAALAETFLELDAEARKRQNQRNDSVLEMTERLEQTNPGSRIRFERSGTTCVVVMVTPSHIVCANAGDSRAILQRGGRTLPLSFDHKPSNVPELERITNAGGFVKSKRVDGDLAVSRGLGDFSYKSNEKMTVEQQKVIPDPEFVVYPRDQEKDEFLVLACDGVWDVATNEECAKFSQDLFDEGETDLGLICEDAMDQCLEKNSRDNMTISLVTFDGAKMASGMNASNAVWKRRTARQAKYFERTAKQAATRAAAGVGLHLTMDSSNTAVPVSSGSK
jgi:serine/threonine protein phosphatase PrpC